MRFRLHTLVDITQTNARRTDNGKEYKQQQNFMTALQTIGLRANIIPEQPIVNKQGVSKLGFGSKYKGSQNVWTLEFALEHVDALDLEMLYNDFDLVPIIPNLDETVDLENPIFQTKNKDLCNIIFEQDDK